VWVAAAEEALPWKSGAFIGAYTCNRAEADESALDSASVAVAVRDLWPPARSGAGPPQSSTLP